MTDTSTSPTAPEADGTGGTHLARRSILTFVGAAGVAIGMTLLFYGMRSVMDIGGSCASGNVPFEIARPCPEGVGLVMVGGIFGGLFALGVYAWNVVGPNLTMLAWPALFLSLGWNFLEYGFAPPDGFGGTAVGWIVCGVLFVLMGGGPLLLGIWAWRSSREVRGAGRLGRAAPGTGQTVGTRARWWPWVLQLGALAFGVWAGIQLFEEATSSVVHIG